MCKWDGFVIISKFCEKQSKKYFQYFEIIFNYSIIAIFNSSSANYYVLRFIDTLIIYNYNNMVTKIQK